MENQRYHGRRRAFLAVAAAAGLGALALRARPFRVAVEGTSMSPTLEPGDYLMAVAVRRGRLRAGQLVVVEHPGRPGYEMVKRLAGLPGDRVAGRVLAANELWVAGDHPSATTDSRDFGPLPRSAIRGVVRIRYWPPGRMAWFR